MTPLKIEIPAGAGGRDRPHPICRSVRHALAFLIYLPAPER